MSQQRFRKPLAILTAVLIATMALTALGPSATHAQDDSQTEVEFIGPLALGDPGFIVVNGQTIDISGAEIDPDVTLTAGEMVKVEAFVVDGAFIAREVQVPDEDDVLPGEIELEGVIDSIVDTTYTIGSFSFEVDTTAEVDAGVMAGELVKVHFMVDDEGNWVVREVTLDTADVGTDDDSDDNGDDNELEDGEDFHLRGTLDEIGDDFIVVSGQHFDLNDLTKVEGTLVAGASVRIEVRLVDGAFVLEEVNFAGHDDDQDQNEDNEDSDEDESDDSEDDSDDDSDDDSVDDSSDDDNDRDDDSDDDDDEDNDSDNSGSNAGPSNTSGSNSGSNDSLDDNSGSSNDSSDDDHNDDDDHDDHEEDDD